MHRQRRHPRLHDTLHELQRVLLARQQPDLRRHRDLRGQRRTERGKDRAERIGVREQRGAHARVCREGLGAAAVEVDACDVLLDGLGGFDCELGVGRADLVDEEGLLDGVRCEDRARLAVVGDDTCYGCRRRMRTGTRKVKEVRRTIDLASCVKDGLVNRLGTPDQLCAVLQGEETGRHCKRRSARENSANRRIHTCAGSHHRC